MHVYLAWMILSHQKKVKVGACTSDVLQIHSGPILLGEHRRLNEGTSQQRLPTSPQLMQAEPHKLDFRTDPLARLPGTGGLGPLGTIGGGLPPAHELTRPPSLFPATGA